MYSLLVAVVGLCAAPFNTHTQHLSNSEPTACALQAACLSVPIQLCMAGLALYT
jgi:hypothetical protein